MFTKSQEYVNINRLTLRCLNFAQEYINSNNITCNIGKVFKEALFQEVEITEDKIIGFYEYNTSCHCHPEYDRYYLMLPSYILDIADGPEYEEDDLRRIEIVKIIDQDKIVYDNEKDRVYKIKQKIAEEENAKKLEIKRQEEYQLFLNLKEQFK